METGRAARLLSNAAVYLLDGHKGVDLPPQVIHGESLAHLPDLKQDEGCSSGPGLENEAAWTV